jgi:hypothetical protein
MTKIVASSSTICILFACAAVLHAQNKIVSVTDYGAKSDGSNSSATTSAFTQAFAAAAPGGKVTVPPGIYAIDNSRGAFTINSFNGELKFEGNATIQFNTSTQSGMLFNSGWGNRVIGFHAKYASNPTSLQNNSFALSFVNTTNTVLNDAIIENSPGRAIYFNNALEPKVSNVVSMSSLGEGIRFDNCRNAEVANVAVTASGDDGVTLFTASGTSGRDGAHLTNVSVTNAKQRGIDVLGGNQVTIGGFHVDSSSGSGVFCGVAESSSLPNQVLFQGGLITNAAGYGIEFQGQQTCSFANIQVDHSGDRGVYGSAPAGTVEIRNVRVTNNGTSDAFNFASTATVLISDSTAENSPGYGFFFESVKSTIANSLTTNNVSKVNSLHRAIWFQNGGSVLASGLNVNDDQSQASGYIIGTAAMGKGTLHSVASIFGSGSLSVQNNSPGVTVTLIN